MQRMTGEWGPGNVFDDDFFDSEASQWSLPSADALWDSLHEENPTQGFPAFRRRDKQRERLRYRFQTRPSLRVAFRKEESSESPSQSDSEATKIVTFNSKEKKKDVEKHQKELKSPTPNNSVTPNSSANNNVSSQTTTRQPAAMATIAPFTYPVYQGGVGQWGPNPIHPHIPLLPGFLPPAGMAPAMIQPTPNILPVVIYSSPPTGPVMMGGGGPMMMGSGPVTMGGGGPVMMGSGPVMMGGGGPVMMGGGPVTMGGGGPVMMDGGPVTMGGGPVTMGGGGLSQVSAFPVNNAVQPATNVLSGNTVGGNMQSSTWLNHYVPENTAMVSTHDGLCVHVYVVYYTYVNIYTWYVCAYAVCTHM